MVSLFKKRGVPPKGKGKLPTSTLSFRPVNGLPLPPNWAELERYPLNPPFCYAVIAEDPGSRGQKYFLDEVPLNPQEGAIYSSLLQTLEYELDVPRGEVDPRTHFENEARRIVRKYKIKATQIGWPKILYYVERDLVGFGIIDGLMRDHNIEDVTVDGIGKPLFVYHRKYESIGTNVVFNEDVPLDNLISRLAHMAGKHVSTAFPICQGTLPGRHRLMATYRREISPYGGTFTIRKFREDPITIVDLLNGNVINHALAAYVWLLMENRATAIVVGSTGSGKTTQLNALLTFTRMNNKLVTIEEVQEVNIAHSNWTALLARENYGTAEEGAKDVGLFDLVKAAMRMRPDILVVGEVRGEEAYVLFQALATGHGGICTLHADDTPSAIQRLTSKPMDVPPSFIPFLDLVLTVRRIAIPLPSGGFRTVRRVMAVDEVVGVGNYVRMFRWDANTDKFVASRFGESVKLARLARDTGVNVSAIVEELQRRSMVIRWVQQRGIRNFRELSAIFEQYRSDKESILETAMKELGLSTSRAVVEQEIRV